MKGEADTLSSPREFPVKSGDYHCFSMAVIAENSDPGFGGGCVGWISALSWDLQLPF